MQVPWQPLIYHETAKDTIYREATVMHYTSGIVYKYQCLREGFYIGYQYYAHRELDGILVQDIKISNPSGISQELTFKSQQKSVHWDNAVTETKQ